MIFQSAAAYMTAGPCSAAAGEAGRTSCKHPPVLLASPARRRLIQQPIVDGGFGVV
jgi:hypothetical protein